MSDNDFVYIMAASYDNVEDARADFAGIKALYDEIHVSHIFDAAVLSKDEKGKVRIDETYQAGAQHGAALGLAGGLALGAVAALFPPIGIGAALVAGGLGGAALGSVVGHYETGLGRGELKELGDALDNGEAGLIVVYSGNYADQVGKIIKTVNKYQAQLNDAATDELVADIKAAEGQK
ncbi:MAG TPA: hypothetical protein VFP05_01035 [Thermomicrobiales bacterium]|nr:hypothetical protein [Thermomicrobiales bacterium]